MSIPTQLHLVFNGNVTTVRSAEIQIDYSIVLTLERYWSVCKKGEIKALGGLGWSSRTVNNDSKFLTISHCKLSFKIIIDLYHLSCELNFDYLISTSITSQAIQITYIIMAFSTDLLKHFLSIV